MQAHIYKSRSVLDAEAKRRIQVGGSVLASIILFEVIVSVWMNSGFV
ncbi:hypothetical protein PX554_05280 [Sphingomonas sp. H39-1-10]|nr:hypothetical protein [Sphingomonas pollutisoli]MDF0487532.1 hypothetical protein [Sphingomonas pollutisoli]